jgi:hypothetical protein
MLVWQCLQLPDGKLTMNIICSASTFLCHLLLVLIFILYCFSFPLLRPVSELFDKKIASFLGMTPVVDAADRAPSVLNGGLGKISPIYWAICLAGAAAIDLYGVKAASQKSGYTPGNYGFDPLNVLPKDEEGKRWMELAEVKNGRLAMIAITAFAVQEFVTKMGVVDQTPLFFKPIGGVLKEYANSGYIN